MDNLLIVHCPCGMSTHNISTNERDSLYFVYDGTECMEWNVNFLLLYIGNYTLSC